MTRDTRESRALVKETREGFTSAAGVGETDHDLHGHADPPQIYAGTITGDDPFGLQPPDAVGNRSGTQPDPSRQLSDTQSPLGLQLAQYRPVDLIEIRSILPVYR